MTDSPILERDDEEGVWIFRCGAAACDAVFTETVAPGDTARRALARIIHLHPAAVISRRETGADDKPALVRRPFCATHAAAFLRDERERDAAQWIADRKRQNAIAARRAELKERQDRRT